MPHSLTSPDSGSRPALLRLLVLVALIVTAASLWYWVSQRLGDDGEVRWFAPETRCDLQAGPCSATLDGLGELTFAMQAEGPFRALVPLPLTARLEGVEAHAVTVTFVGRDMDMGLHRFVLDRDADGVFRGVGQVTICSQAVMPWRARVVVETPRGRWGSRFDFDVEQQG